MNINSLYVNWEPTSVEVTNEGVPYNVTSDYDIFDLLDDDLLGISTNIAGSCNSTELAQSIDPFIDTLFLDRNFDLPLIPSAISDVDPNRLALNDLPLYPVEKSKKTKSNKKVIPLSSSVGIGTPQRTLNDPYRLEIVNELEEKYRPRYKTDYFALNGLIRKPRYVTDRHNNHYISLRVPMGIQGKIRVDWVTIPDENGNRFVMPYKFQTSNDKSNAKDLNPIYENIKPDATGGEHKLYLVLIKAKQDALKTLQPLQPFRPFQDLFGFHNEESFEKTVNLSPKKLIQKYQLEKSQLVFTLCKLSADGQAYVPEWDTMVYSTVIEEESTNNSSGKVTCPNCSTEFSLSDDSITIQDSGTNKRKSLPVIGQKTTTTIKKQKSLNSSMLIAID